MVKRLLAKRLLAASLAAAALVSLTTCELFRMSAFPDFLSRVVAARDLGTQLDPLVEKYGDEWEAQVRVLRDASGDDYVFVRARAFENKRLVVLNSDLEVLGTFDDPALGTRMMVDANDRFAVGGVVLNNPPTSRTSISAGGPPDAAGFAASGTNFVLWVDSWPSPDLLNYESYFPTWGVDVLSSVVIDSATRPDDWNLPLVFFDPKAADREVVLVLSNWSDGMLQFVFTPARAYQTGTWSGDILTYPGFLLSAWDIRDINYTRRGIVVSDYNDNLRVYDFEGSLREGLQEEQNYRSEILQAYDLDGVYFYYFDKTGRLLYKGLTGWPEL